MTVGAVKWFNATKGCGVIAVEDGTKVVFVHHGAVEGSRYKELIEGQKVEFDSEQGPKGPQTTGARVA